MAEQYVITAPPRSAVALLYSNYLHSLWDSRKVRLKSGQAVGASRDISGLTKTEFYPVYHRRFESLLKHSGSILLAITSPEPSQADWVGAWILADRAPDELRVHWVFVKGPYRRQGFATALLDAALREAGDPPNIVATHGHPRWTDKMNEMGIRREPLGKVG